LSAGEQLDAAHKAAARAAGLLSLMIEKRQVKRSVLEETLQLLDASTSTIRRVLTPNSSGNRVGVLTPENPGDENGTEDQSG
jgi:hypothetical protein